MNNTIILPLDLHETEDEKVINVEVATIVDKFNSVVTDAHTEFISSISQNTVVPKEVKQALLGKHWETDTFVKRSVSIINARRQATIEDAKIIFGENYIGPEAVGSIFKSVFISKVLLLPFTVAQLEHAVNTDCILVYQPAYKNGTSIGLSQFPEVCKGLQQKPHGNLLHIGQFQQGAVPQVLSSAWFSEKQYSHHWDSQIMQPNCFRLATRTILPGSINLNFVDQLLVLCDWVANLIQDTRIPTRFSNAIRDFRINSTALAYLQDTDPPAFLKKISTYKIWDLCMETGLETLFRMTAYNQITGKLIFSDCNTGTRNKVIEPANEYIGYSGRWNLNGPGLDRLRGWHSYSNVGLVFSCLEIE